MQTTMWFISTNVGLLSLRIIQQQRRVDIMWHVVRQSTAHVGLFAGLRMRKRDRGNDRSCVYTCEGLVPSLGENHTVVVTWVTIYQHLLWHQTLSTEVPPSHLGETETGRPRKSRWSGFTDGFTNNSFHFSFISFCIFFSQDKAATQ